MSRYEYKGYYRTIDDGNKQKINGTDDYAYNKTKFNIMMDNHQYTEAANYLSQFKFKDPALQASHMASINTIKRQGRRFERMYQAATSDDDKQGLDFYSVFKETGKAMTDRKNKWAKQYGDIKSTLGDDEALGFKCNAINITYAPKKRTLWGIDWLAKDNENNIENFYKRIGFDKDYLVSKGVNIFTNKDGSTTVSFDKSNEFADLILTNINTDGNLFQAVKGIDIKKYINNPHYNNSHYNNPHIDPITRKAYLDEQGFSIEFSSKTFDDSDYFEKHDIEYDNISYILNLNKLVELQNIVSKTTKSYEETERKIKTEPKEVSGVYGDYVSPQLEEYRRMLRNGDIKATEFNSLVKGLPDPVRTIKDLNAGSIKLYCNSFDSEDNDVLEQQEEPQTRKILTWLSMINDKNISVRYGTMNNEYGFYVTVDAQQNNDDKKNTYNPDEINDKSRVIKMFIPNVDGGKAQLELSKDPIARSTVELNDMQNWGYDYVTSDDKTIKYQNGNFYLDNELISKADAQIAVAKDGLMENAISQLSSMYINSKGDYTSQEKLEENAKVQAAQVVLSLYPGSQLINRVQGKTLSIADAFDPNYNLSELSYSDAEKVDMIRNTYHDLIQSLSKYYTYE